MATRNTYPSHDEIAAGVARLGSVTAYAKEVGIRPRSLREYVQRTEGLADQIEDARSAFSASSQEEAAEAQPTREDILQQQLKEAQRVASAHRQNAVLEERIFERLVEHIPVAQTRYQPPTIRERDGYDEHEFVLLFSDTHAGEVVEPEATLGMNEYTWDIMLERMAKMQKSVISYQQNRPYPIRKLWIPMLGDMFSGDIHEELRITNDRTIDEAVVDFSMDVVAWLQAFKPHFDEISVVGVPGNHPRRDKKPMAKMQQANADWLHYKFVEAMMAGDDQFTFNFPRSHYADAYVCGEHHVLFMHGDGIRSTMPGVPWGGVARRVTTLQAQFAKAGMPIDYVAMGHFHTTNAVEGVGVKTFLNGSVKGVDEYSIAAFGSGQDPTQMLLTFHPVHGITDVSYLDLAPRDT